MTDALIAAGPSSPSGVLYWSVVTPGAIATAVADGPARIAGRDAQHAFWGEGNVVAQSLLHQLALQIAP